MIERRLAATGLTLALIVGVGAALAMRPAAASRAHAAAPAAVLTPLTPARLLDTRGGPHNTTVDGAFQGGGLQPAGSVLELTVTDRGGVPATASAVFLNLTAVLPEGPGYVTAFPCGTERPTASHVNYAAGATVPNGVLVGVGDGGNVCIFTLAATHLLADVTAYVPAASSPRPVTPARFLDTRGGDGHVTFDGAFQGEGQRAAGSVLELTVAGRGDVPADASAVFLNLTAVGPAAHGYLTAFACGAARPQASHVNYTPGSISPNGVLVGIGTGGKVCVFTLAATHLLADVTAFVPTGEMPTPVEPARLLETRDGPNDSTVDDQYEAIGRVPDGHFVRLAVAGRGGVPEDATAVFLNLTAVEPLGNGYLAAWPCGTERPKASHVNYQTGEIRPNGALVGIGSNGQVCIFTLAPTHIVADVTAYVAPDPEVGGTPHGTSTTTSPSTSTTTLPEGTSTTTTTTTTSSSTTTSTTTPPEAPSCDEPGTEWGTLTPEQANMDGAALESAITASMGGQSFAVRVYRYGCLVATDAGHPGNELVQYESWSMAKSVTSMVFGRAYSIGLIEPDDTVAEWFPEADAAHGALTLRQLLEQNSGLDLNPVRDYNIAVPDRIRTALNTAIVAEPGTTFGYSQHGPALVAEAVSRAVQGAGYDDFQDFADEELFAKLGIERGDWYWRRDCPTLTLVEVTTLLLTLTPEELLAGATCATGVLGQGTGHTQGFFGLNMRPNDFARLGELMRRGGVWNGERLLSETYTSASLAPNSTNGCHGWLIWINGAAPCAQAGGWREGRLYPDLPADMFAFNGLLGQHVAVFPTQDIVVVRVGAENVTGDTFFQAGLTSHDGSMGALYAAVVGAVTDQTVAPPGPAPEFPQTSQARTGLTADAFAAALADPLTILGPLLLEGLPLP